MSVINTQDNLFAGLGLSTADTSSKGTNDATELGLTTFLKLMVTQLNNQDPFKPMENGEFLGQIAQFGSVTGLEQLNKSFESFAATVTSGQALQAGSLVGHEVLVPVATGYLEAGGSMRGQVDLAQSSSQVTARVTDQVGQLVREIPLGAASAGELQFSWDGMDDTGNYAPPGLYSIQIEAMQNDRAVEMQTQMFATVESVNLSGSNGLMLNLAGLGQVSLNNVQQIY